MSLRRPGCTDQPLSYQEMEPRRLLAAANPSNFDQYVIELINLARTDPAAYAARLGIDLNEGLPAGTISSARKQPLALNRFITDAAQKHSAWMLANNILSHTGINGTNPGQRMQNAGYVFTPPSSWSENIAVRSTNGTVNVLEFTKSLQDALFVDRNYPGRAHRVVMMDPNWKEIGVGVVVGKYKGNNGVMLTQDFAYSAGHSFLTGVGYADTVTRDHFYTPGEGLGGITITAIRDGGGQTFTTTTTSSGGYSLRLAPGRYSIMASGGGLGQSQFLPNVMIGAENRKIDFVQGVVRQAPEVAVFGNGQSIIHANNQPSLAQHTHFGSANVGANGVTRTFTIRNHGNSKLSLTWNPLVITTNPRDFQVISMPSASIPGGGSTSFTVRFTPSAAGLRTGQIRFGNNDSNEHPFLINIAGEGTSSMPPAGMLRPGDAPGSRGGGGGGDSGGNGFSMLSRNQENRQLNLAGSVKRANFPLDQLDQFVAIWSKVSDESPTSYDFELSLW